MEILLTVSNNAIIRRLVSDISVEYQVDVFYLPIFRISPVSSDILKIIRMKHIMIGSVSLVASNVARSRSKDFSILIISSSIFTSFDITFSKSSFVKFSDEVELTAFTLNLAV